MYIMHLTTLKMNSNRVLQQYEVMAMQRHMGMGMQRDIRNDGNMGYLYRLWAL
jgi:hypothetical protein